MMKLGDGLLYAWKNLGTARLRSYLTIIGIVIGVIAMVTITSISEGVQRDINSQLAAFGPDKMFITPGAIKAGSRGGLSPIGPAMSGKLFEREADIIANIPGVKTLSKGAYGRTTVEFKDKSITSVLYGMDSNYFEQWKDYIQIETGRPYKENEGRVAVLGYKAANDMFGKNRVSVGNSIIVAGKEYRVVGILKEIGTSLSASDDSSIYIPYTDAKKEFTSQLSPGEINFISIQIAEGFDTKTVEEAIDTKLISLHKVTEDERDFTIITSDFINETIGSLISRLGLFLLFITMIATIVGGIGIMNTMFMGVLERVQEIGVLKSIGATERDILLIFVSESGMLGFLGGSIGLIVGLILTLALGQFGVPYWIRYRVVIFAFSFSAIIGILAGFIPARQAAKMDPVDALRYE